MLNDRFESQWKYHLEHGNELPNDAWIKELARHFFKLGWHNNVNCTTDEVEDGN